MGREAQSASVGGPVKALAKKGARFGPCEGLKELTPVNVSNIVAKEGSMA